MPYTQRDLTPSSEALAARAARIRQAALEREALQSSYQRFQRIAFGA